MISRFSFNISIYENFKNFFKILYFKKNNYDNELKNKLSLIYENSNFYFFDHGRTAFYEILNQIKKKTDKRKPKPLSFDQMFRRFKKKVERDGTLQEVRKREFYEKPAQRKQRKMKEAIRKEKLRHESDGIPSQRYF